MFLAFQYMGQNHNKKGGVVVNIASILGLDPNEVAPVYSGIKQAVVGLTRAFGVRDRMCDFYNVAQPKWWQMKAAGACAAKRQWRS
jgi:short-subunit dehydrogenase involved in D-alanine esterification of teichoic acids